MKVLTRRKRYSRARISLTSIVRFTKRDSDHGFLGWRLSIVLAITELVEERELSWNPLKLERSSPIHSELLAAPSPSQRIRTGLLVVDCGKEGSVGLYAISRCRPNSFACADMAF